jgi:hypothetical protein
VTYEGLLYKCSTAVTTAGAWDATKWTAVSAMGEMPAPITVDSAMSSSSTNPVQNKVVDEAVKGRVPWTSLNETRALLWSSNGAGTATGMRAMAIGLNPVATGNNALARGNTATASGNSTTAIGYLVHADAYASVALGFRAKTDGTNNAHSYAFVWQGLEAGADYYAQGFGTFNINPTPKTGSTDPATGFYIGTKNLPKVIAENTNLLPYASTTTLDPATAVYRATATLSGTTATMPTVTITGIPTAAAYFAFELEVAVDATATALDDTAWSGWTWMDGGELPTADYAGKTLYIACRLDCTARTIKANCYEVA